LPVRRGRRVSTTIARACVTLGPRDGYRMNQPILARPGWLRGTLPPPCCRTLVQPDIACDVDRFRGADWRRRPRGGLYAPPDYRRQSNDTDDELLRLRRQMTPESRAA
jgi:hypothetical protein